MLWGANSIRFLGALAIGAALLAPSVSQAGQDAEVCYAALDELTGARGTLEQLQAAVDGAKADREMLTARRLELSAQLAMTRDETARAEIKADLNAVRSELDTIADLLPSIERQATALAAELETAERAYIACIEATIE